jgi:hypothetical protein
MHAIVRGLVAIATLIVLGGPAQAQLVPERQRAALNLITMERMPLNVQADMTADCEISGEALLEQVFTSLNYSDVDFVRGDADDSDRLTLTIRLFGTREYGCAAFLIVEVMQALRVDLPYSGAAYEGDVVLVRLDHYFGPTANVGSELEEEFLDFLGPTLIQAWELMKLEALP